MTTLGLFSDANILSRIERVLAQTRPSDCHEYYFTNNLLPEALLAAQDVSVTWRLTFSP